MPEILPDYTQHVKRSPVSKAKGTRRAVLAALVLALFLVACNRVGNDSNGTGTPDPTGTAATATPAGDVTQGVTPGGKPTGEPETTPTAAPEPTGTAVEWPEFGQYKPTEIPELSGKWWGASATSIKTRVLPRLSV